MADEAHDKSGDQAPTTAGTGWPWAAIALFVFNLIQCPLCSQVAHRVGLASMIIMNIYLAALLFAAAVRAHSKAYPGKPLSILGKEIKAEAVRAVFPFRIGGLVLVFFCMATLVVAGANVYLSLPPGSFNVSTQAASTQLTFAQAYFLSGSVAAGLGFADITPLSDYARMLVMLQMFSGYLLFAVIVSFLIGRIVGMDTEPLAGGGAAKAPPPNGD